MSGQYASYWNAFLFYKCVSDHRGEGCLPQCMLGYPPPGPGTPPGGRPPRPGTPPRSRPTPLDQAHPPPGGRPPMDQAPPQSRHPPRSRPPLDQAPHSPHREAELQHTVKERPVRILLECISCWYQVFCGQILI